jgi:hypothetical protein
MQKYPVPIFFLLVLSLLIQITPVFSSQDSRAIKRKSNDLRQALVIGNGSYAASPLKNPVNDAADLAAALKMSGFKVTLLKDADQRQMEEAIIRFGKRLRKGGTGLFYYAGHGIQYRGRNYLIPLKARIESESDVKYEAVDAGRVLGKMEDAGNAINIVILDACRNNPFARSFRSATQGLARMDAPTGSLVAYATAPGSVAADGRGRNGVYTKYLLQYMQQPDLTVNQVLMKVRKAVLRETGKKQTPWESSSLTGDFYFRQGGSIQVDSPDPAPGPGKLTGSLLVRTEPSKVKIWIDGGFEGRSPVQIDDMIPGLVQVRAAKKGVPDQEEKVRIRAGRRSELTLILAEPEPTTGRLSVSTEPADARIRILNIVPRYKPGMELKPGSYILEVSAYGYQTDTRTVNLKAGEELQVDFALEEVQAANTQPTAQRTGKTWTEPVTGMEFVYVKGGVLSDGLNSRWVR